jgi:outer membrane protein
MKKIILGIAIVMTIVSCEKTTSTTTKEFKTAYVETSELLKESLEAKDIEAKYKAKASEMDVKLKGEASKLEAEKNSFQANAVKNGEAWAQKKYGELQQRNQQLQYAQQGMLQQLQEESGVEMDSLVNKYKRTFKEYGKKQGFDYLFGTGESTSILYAKDGYNVTKEVIKIINEEYKNSDKKEEKTAEKK